MNDSRLDFDLKRLSERSIPELPENFHALVWARIHAAKSIALQEKWLDGLVATFLRLRWAPVTLAITLLVGASLGRVFTNADEGRVHGPLGFDVFAADAPTLPSTVLGQFR